MMVMPFSRSRSMESIIRSATVSFLRKRPDCQSMASTRVVLPWSTWAMIAILRIESRCCICPLYHAARHSRATRMYNGATLTPLEAPFMTRFSLIFLGILTLGCASVGVAQDKPAADKKPAAAPSAADRKPAGKQAAVITMEKGGEIRFEFYPADAPKTVENFVKLANDKFYDGTTFHRVEPSFVIQGGEPLSKTLPQGDPKIGTGDPGYKIKAEFNKQKHDRGAVAMARSQHPDSAR